MCPLLPSIHNSRFGKALGFWGWRLAHRRICAAGVGEFDGRHVGDCEMGAVSRDVPVRAEGWVLAGSQPVPVSDGAVALDQNVSPASEKP